MYSLLYFAFWIIIAIVLNKCGVTTDKLEFWIIFLSIIVILSVRIKLYEKDKEEETKSGP